MNKHTERILDIELEKFRVLCEKTRTVLPMFSGLIDKRWHERIGTGDLNMLIHDSNIRTNIREKIKWIENYENLYGKLASVWFMNSEEVVDISCIKEYFDSGNVLSVYNCAGYISNV